MNITFKSIELNNFLSFEEAIINLDTNGYTLVNGINNNPDDLAKSNGSGKSSIWEAISWCLTGETIRGVKDVKRLGADKCSVRLFCNIDGDDYQIMRSKDPSNLKIIVNDKDISSKGIRDNEKILADRLPDLTSSLIGSVIILGQGLPQRFTNNSPSGRKEVLEKLSKSDFMITDMKNRISNRQMILNSKIKDIELDTSNLNGRISSINNEIKSNKEKLQEIESMSNIDSEINNLRLIFENRQNERYELDTIINTLTANIENFRAEHVEKQKWMFEEKDAVRDSFDVSIKRLTDKLSGLYATLTAKENELIKLQSIKDVCPTCGQKLQGVVRPDTSSLEKEVVELKENIKTIQGELKHVENEQSLAISEVESKYRDTLEAIASNIKINTLNLNDYNSRLIETSNAVESINKSIISLEAKKNSLNDRKDDIKASIERLEKSLVEINDKILYNNNDKLNLEVHLSVINSFNTIIKRDFRGYLLKGIIDYISKKSKEYSNIVFNTDKIDFYLDGNNISISYDNKLYESLSGGERQKIDLIVQFAIRDMLCKYLNFSSNIIVLDEIFDNLDSEGCNNILNLISTKLRDVQSIFIVTHHSDLSIPADDEITVVKGADKISRIK